MERHFSMIVFSVLALFLTLVSCSKEDNYLTEKFVDTWIPKRYQLEDCTDDGVDNSYDTNDLLDLVIECGYCTSFVYPESIGGFRSIKIRQDNILEIHILEIAQIEIYEYAYSYDANTRTISISDNSENYQIITGTDEGLLLEGIKDGCKTMHHMLRE